MVNKELVYSKIGMALISAQRVEFVAGSILELLREFDETVYDITSQEFLNGTKKGKQARKTLGLIFQQLKLNPNLVIANELDEYLKLRNIFVHGFWKKYLNTLSQEQAEKAISFCYEFGRYSNRLESFFKGFTYFLALRHVNTKDELSKEMKQWEQDFNFFLSQLSKQNLMQS